jgi:hypothetical protein
VGGLDFFHRSGVLPVSIYNQAARVTEQRTGDDRRRRDQPVDEDRRVADRRRGRPRLRDGQALRSNVSVKFATPTHDELLQLASRRGTTVPELLRDWALTELRKSRGPQSLVT